MLVVARAIRSPFRDTTIFAGVVSGIWLAFLGEWSAIGYGFLLFAAGSLAYAVAFDVGVDTALFYIRKIRRLRFVEIPAALCGQLLTFIIVVASFSAIFSFLISRSGTASGMPPTIWAYSISLGSWMYASGQIQNDFTALFGLFFQIAGIAFAMMLGLGLIHVKWAMVTFVSIMGIGFLLSIRTFLEAVRDEDWARPE